MRDSRSSAEAVETPARCLAHLSLAFDRAATAAGCSSEHAGRKGDRGLHAASSTSRVPALKAHPRFHLHFTPTSASWLNMVERFFAEITRNRIRRGAFKSVAELKSAIIEYLDNHNADPKPFVWTKSAGQILEKVARAKQALESQH
jgi:hypothetical protein